MIKNLNFRQTMKILGLRSSESNSERTIVRNLFDAYQAIGSKSHTKDSNATQRVITSTIKRKELKEDCLIRKTSKSLNISRTTLSKALKR